MCQFNNVCDGDDSYKELNNVFQSAFKQAAYGKGKERHVQGTEPFEEQPIVEIGKRLQNNPAAGPLFQAVKKIYESGMLSKEQAITELYGAINYIAAAIIIRKGIFDIREKSDAIYKNARMIDKPKKRNLSSFNSRPVANSVFSGNTL